MFLPKLGIDTVLELRDGSRYAVRGRTFDLSVINELAFTNPYLGHGYVAIAPDAVVVDVGANIGDFAVQAARLCPQGRVIAVEPLRSAGAMIATQARLNGLSNVTWFHAALSGVEGQPSARQDGAFYQTAADIAESPRVLTLGGLMTELGLTRIDLLKLDCEGAEWDILPAAEARLPQVAQICMEYHLEGGWTAEKLADWLTARGFTVKVNSGGGWNGLLWARRGGLL
jgi:FkbM family methyltransferase